MNDYNFRRLSDIQSYKYLSYLIDNGAVYVIYYHIEPFQKMLNEFEVKHVLKGTDSFGAGLFELL